MLHDIGYAHPDTGFHALDGARFLARAGFSRRVCHTVVYHSASTWEAQERGLDPAIYAGFELDDAVLGSTHAVLWWDMTTGRVEDAGASRSMSKAAAVAAGSSRAGVSTGCW